ncbi:MAG: uracil-DNA glycosylase [Alphaproteobacteria bacterium]|nr:uracil-DNA glycosylase [Alphaproteobacteria bacterium]
MQHGDIVPGDAVRKAIGSRLVERGGARAGNTPASVVQTGGRSSQSRGGQSHAQGRAPRPGAAGAPATQGRPNAGQRAPAPRSASHNEPGPAAARKAALEAKSLEELRTALESFEACALHATAKNTCFYRGAERARLMIIGEAPGRDEDIAGKPFVGRAGQLLDRMLASIGLTEAEVHITNVVYWRPPGNRTPTAMETDTCRPFLERQAQFVAPEYVLLVGGSAAKSVLNLSEGIMKLRGKWRELTIGGHSVKAIATLHPAYLLRTPAAKRLAWRDLVSLRKALSP